MPSLATQIKNLNFFAGLKTSKADPKLEFNRATGLFSSYSGTGFTRMLGNKLNSNSFKQSVMNDSMFSDPIRDIFSDAAANRVNVTLMRAALQGLERVARSYSGDPAKSMKISELIKELGALHDPFRISDISKPNAKWGICGFASSLAALYDTNVLNTKVQGRDLPTRILAEIKTYLVMLQSENPLLLREIENFTRGFGKKWAGFRIETFIQKINNVTNPDVVDLGEGFDIAMPKNAVIDFLRRNGKKGTHEIELHPLRTGVILGLGDMQDKSLRHWVYKHSADKVYNYGKDQPLRDCLIKGPYTVVHQISIG
jgi:hypothetical protein